MYLPHAKTPQIRLIKLITTFYLIWLFIAEFRKRVENCNRGDGNRTGLGSVFMLLPLLVLDVMGNIDGDDNNGDNGDGNDYHCRNDDNNRNDDTDDNRSDNNGVCDDINLQEGW